MCSHMYECVYICIRYVHRQDEKRENSKQALVEDSYMEDGKSFNAESKCLIGDLDIHKHSYALLCIFIRFGSFESVLSARNKHIYLCIYLSIYDVIYMICT